MFVTAQALVLLSAGLLFNSHCLKPMLLIFCGRLYLKQVNYTTHQLVRQIVAGQTFFTILLCIWAEFFATSILDYTPILVYSLLTITEIRQSVLSTVEKKKQLRESFTYLLNNCQLYVLAYHLIELFFSSQPVGLVKILTLFYMLKTKYGFNPYMQKIFHNTHTSIVESLVGSRTLLAGYMVLYKAINVVGKIYFQGVQQQQPQRRVVLLKKTQ